ncbi:hypothetical protein OKW35_010027, partial [Paraburkholderia sp. MM5477-R1]
SFSSARAFYESDRGKPQMRPPGIATSNGAYARVAPQMIAPNEIVIARLNFKIMQFE